MTSCLFARAPAKINLSLHVVARRADGYHELDSLVAFAGIGDGLRLEPGPGLALVTTGPTAGLAGHDSNNLVLKAARLLAERVPGLRTGGFLLTKRLPVAAGLGGGSSDAAAALRLLARLNGLALSNPAVLEAARHAGADVPVCLEGRARVMGGIGERLGPALRLPPLFSVLANAGVAVPTPDVFRALGINVGESRNSNPVEWDTTGPQDFLAALREARNDLDVPATKLQPVIADALRRMGEAEGCQLARMSGSGATIFGLFADRHTAVSAARTLAQEQPGWWVRPTILR